MEERILPRFRAGSAGCAVAAPAAFGLYEEVSQQIYLREFY